MKRVLLSFWLLCLATVWLAPDQSWGQAAEGELRFRKFDTRRVPSPFMKVTDGRAGNRSVWWQIYVEFETMGGKRGADGNGWHDRAEVDLTVWIPVTGGKDILMKRTVAYRDLEDKVSPHVVDFYIRPRFIDRYVGRNANPRDMQVFVEIRGIGRQPVRHDSLAGKKGLWWTMIDTTKLDLRNEELLLRSETPFAVCDYDFYEDVPPASAGKR